MERTDLLEGLWEEVYRNVRRADQSLHERNGEELERTGQPLCIYEPYFGEGTWRFLHRTSLYRGLRLVSDLLHLMNPTFSSSSFVSWLSGFRLIISQISISRYHSCLSL